MHYTWNSYCYYCYTKHNVTYISSLQQAISQNIPSQLRHKDILVDSEDSCNYSLVPDQTLNVHQLYEIEDVHHIEALGCHAEAWMLRCSEGHGWIQPNNKNCN